MIHGELMDGDGNAIGDGTCAAEFADGRLIIRGDVSMLIEAHRKDARLPGDEPTNIDETVVMTIPVEGVTGDHDPALEFVREPYRSEILDDAQDRGRVVQIIVAADGVTAVFDGRPDGSTTSLTYGGDAA